jgi:hypothetical protein
MVLLTKVGLIAPVTAVDFFIRDDTKEVILVSGCGGNMDYYCLSSDLSLQRKKTIEVFQTHSIHGINCRSLGRGGEIVIVFGAKAVRIFYQKSFDSFGCCVNTDDLVLACEVACLPNLGECVLVGCAHNFIDLFQMSPTHEHMLRIQNAHACVLFSMSFSFPSFATGEEKSSVCVASGTAEGCIVLW